MEIRELNTVESKYNYMQILKVLQQYYTMHLIGIQSTCFQFRNVFLKELHDQIDNCVIQLRRINQFEFLIIAILPNGDSNSWIHIDGIQQEREDYLKKGVKSNPVFEICCLTDLWNAGIIINPDIPKEHDLIQEK